MRRYCDRSYVCREVLNHLFLGSDLPFLRISCRMFAHTDEQPGARYNIGKDADQYDPYSHVLTSSN
jgi:hypothetical protein